MDAFEKAFESIEVSLGTMTGALESTTASLVPDDEVDALMQLVAQACFRAICHCHHAIM